MSKFSFFEISNFSLFRRGQLERAEWNRAGVIIGGHVFLQEVIVLRATDFRDIDLFALEPARQETIGEALVVRPVWLLELDEGLAAQVADGAFNWLADIWAWICHNFFLHTRHKTNNKLLQSFAIINF